MEASSEPMTLAVYAVFTLTYLLIASRRLALLPIGRPAGALVGAVLMVIIGALTPQESYAAIDHNTIILLFGTMVITIYLESNGFFEWLAGFILSGSKTPLGFLMSVSLVSGFLSALMVNDTVCLFLTPMVVSACLRAGLPPGPYLIALATSANIGSAATLVGNPQNMIIGSLSGLSFTAFARSAVPAAAVGILINMGLLWIYYRRRLPDKLTPYRGNAIPYDRRGLFVALATTAAVVGGFFAGFHLGYTALAGVMVLILAENRDPRHVFARVDWSLLVFFCCLFIVVAGLDKTGIIEKSWNFSAPYLSFSNTSGLVFFSGLMTLGSNIISNVPMVLMTGPYLSTMGSEHLGWVLLSFTTTVAGNFTILGSVANIIVAERARDHYTLGFFEYLRFGIVSTVAVLLAGVTVIVLTVG